MKSTDKKTIAIDHCPYERDDKKCECLDKQIRNKSVSDQKSMQIPLNRSGLFFLFN